MTIVLDVAKVLLMHLEHRLSETALAGLTVRAPAAAPRFSFHSGYYCEDCSHAGADIGALLTDSPAERDLACASCCTYDPLELPGERVSRLGQRCAADGCERRLRDGAWIVGDRAESFALCFRCAVADVIEAAPLTLAIEAVNAVGGEPTLNDVLTVLGYRTEVAGKFGQFKNILSAFGDVVLGEARAHETWEWLRKQGLNTRSGKPALSISEVITRGALALQPAISEALRLRRELLASASIEDEVA